MPPLRFPVEPEVTMETVLRLPAVRRGAPELLAGAERLQEPVRWAHSCEARHIAGLLEGGELLLMTGMGLGTAAADQRAFVRELVDHDVAGLVVELGRVFRALPEALVAEARRLRLPLVALREEVRFVEVTEQLHTALLGRRTVAEGRVAQLTALLLAAMLEGEGVEALLDTLASVVGNPAVLERTNGEVVFHAAHRSPAADVLAHLRQTEAEPVASAEARGPGPLAAAVVARPGGATWGRLVVLGHERPIDALTRLAVERTAPLVAVALRRSGEADQLRTRERGNFLHDLVTGAVAGAEAAARATELGAGEAARRADGAVRLLPVAAAWRDGVDEEHRAQVLRDARRRLPGRGLAGLVGSRAAEDDVLVVVAVPPGVDRATTAEAVAGVLATRDRSSAPHGVQGPLTVAVGPVAAGWDDVADGLRRAVETAHTMRDAAPVGWHDTTEPDVGRLLWGLREDPHVAAFASQRLQPVLRHDRQRRATLLPTLRALSESHWHKARAARTLGIQRQSLYARVQRLEALLGADLDDPAVRLGLDLAVRAQAAPAA